MENRNETTSLFDCIFQLFIYQTLLTLQAPQHCGYSLTIIAGLAQQSAVSERESNQKVNYVRSVHYNIVFVLIGDFPFTVHDGELKAFYTD